MATANKPQLTQAPKAGDEEKFYADFITVHPRAVKGLFRNLKWWAMAILLAWWHLGPFLRWDRGPGAPDQAVLVDMEGRRAYFFFIEIWPQEVYYLTGLLLIAAIALFLMSALAGRVWCGFLCWQTVYTDLFQNVERWVVGDRAKRIAMDRRPWDAEKLFKRGLINVIWFIISAACGIGFVLYFGDAFQMLREIFTLQASGGVYGTIAVIGGFCFLLAGYAREQVCIYMCPYSRFQASMVDEHSLIVAYEGWRGEPRAPARLGQSFEGRGHCVDCKLCVTSCPTGIDIREGSQLACIGCGLCIDACNGIMDKHGLPRGLISYDSITNQTLRGQNKPAQYRLVRPRTAIYTAILTAVGGLMLYSLIFRSTTEVNVLHERAPLYVQMSDGSIRNGYEYKILNMIRQDRTYELKVGGIEGATISVVGGDENVTQTDLLVAGDQVGSFRLYVSAPQDKITGKRTDLYFILTEKSEGRQIRSTTLFAGP